MSLRDASIAVFVAMLWGAQVTAVKIGGAELPPLFMVGVRFLLMSVVLVPFTKLPPRDMWIPIGLIATVYGSLHFGLLYLGISMVDASSSAVVYQLATPFTVVLAAVTFGDRISWVAGIGIVLAILGVAILMGGIRADGNTMGFILVALAAFAFAVGTIVIKRLGPFKPLSLNAWVALFGAPQVLILSLILERNQLPTIINASVTSWIALGYTAVSGGILGFALWYWLLNRYPVSRLAPFTLLVPLFAVGFSVPILCEHLSFSLILGGAVVIAGVLLCQYRPAIPRSAPAEAH